MIEKQCLFCYKKFKVYYSRKDSAHYCSLECRNKSYLNKHFSKNTEFKKGQTYTKERNLKISQTHQKNKKNVKEMVVLYCIECNKPFKVKPYLKNIRKYCSHKCHTSSEYTRKATSLRLTGYKFSKKRNKKISDTMKGILPKNWTQILNNKSCFYQKKMYKIIKKYFKNIKYEYCVLIKPKRRRFLDVACLENQIDFEYDGMIHLSHNVQKNDIKREKELYKLGWTIYRFNNKNFMECENIIQQLYAEHYILKNNIRPMEI